MEQTGPKGEGEERPRVRAADTGHRASTAAQCGALRVAAWNRTATLCIHFVAIFFVVCDECTRLSVRDSAIAVATLLLVAFRLDVVVVVDSKNPSIATCRGSFCLRFVFEQF